MATKIENFEFTFPKKSEEYKLNPVITIDSDDIIEILGVDSVSDINTLDKIEGRKDEPGGFEILLTCYKDGNPVFKTIQLEVPDGIDDLIGIVKKEYYGEISVAILAEDSSLPEEDNIVVVASQDFII